METGLGGWVGIFVNIEYASCPLGLADCAPHMVSNFTNHWERFLHRTRCTLCSTVVHTVIMLSIYINRYSFSIIKGTEKRDLNFEKCTNLP